MKHKILGVIPARWGSSRFPGKALADVLGKTMVARVYEQASQAKSLDKVVIATDDARIAEHMQALGAPVAMTRPEHPSGTDRCLEALQLSGYEADYVLNIQGDEPFIDPNQIDQLAAVLDGQTQIATLIKAADHADRLGDPGEVCVARDVNGYALYFSRSVIPYLRNTDRKDWFGAYPFFFHLGLYAYRADVLKDICALPPSALELAESLEQLRWLEHGYRVRCVETTGDSHTIDTPEDLERVKQLFAHRA